VNDGFDVAEALRSARTDGVLLRFIEEFAAAFSRRPISDGDGVDESELREAEERVAARLPSALREAYLLFGRRADLTSIQDPLLPPSALRLDAAGAVLVFREENQSCASWGVPLDALTEHDPRVLVERGDGWFPFLDSMSLAVVELVLQETALLDESRLNICELPANEVSKVLTGYSRVEFPDYPNWASEEFSPVRWYSAPGRLLRVDGTGSSSWLIASGQREPDLYAMVREIPGDWTLGSGFPEQL